MEKHGDNVKLGLKENWKQFSLLVLVNAFVGGMVGLERTILPQIAEADFGLAAKTAILSFIIVFGVTKAFTNYYAGVLANRMGRRNLLILGWLFALPVPVILMEADHWNWIIAANILLGINQGLAWSSTVVMKIDLVGERNRGFAMGLNEFAGYVALAAVAFATGYIAHEYGLRPYPFYLGIALAVVGFVTSLIFIKDTKKHVLLESVVSTIPKLRNVFWDTTWNHRNIGSVTQAGLVNNLNDGMVWGLFPILLAAKGFDLNEIGIIVAIYPAIWGVMVKDAGGLTATAKITIEIEKIDKKNIVNPLKGFSPDGDGINDLWLIQGIEAFPDNEVKIFNRWGNLVFNTRNYNNNNIAWRGESDGRGSAAERNTPETTFFYIITINGLHPLTGYVIMKQ